MFTKIKFHTSLMICLFSFSAHALVCETLIEETKDFKHCKNQMPPYPRPVHVYIPKNIIPKKDIHVHVHFHGHNLMGYDHFDKKISDYGKDMIKGKKDSILVIPESVGNCTTYDQFLSVKKNQQDFFKALEEQLNFPIESLSMSGHSGAYRVLNTLTTKPIIDIVEKKTKGIALFDSPYGPVNNLASFINQKLSQDQNFKFYLAVVSGNKATTKNWPADLYGQIVKGKELIEDPNCDCLKGPHNKLNHYLLSQNIKYMKMPSDSRETLDLHFDILKKYGIEDFLKQLP